MAKIVDQHGKEWPSQEAYFAAMEQKSATAAAISRLALDVHKAQKQK
jgi:hypothetical protein